MANKNVVYLINLVTGQGREMLGFVSCSPKVARCCLKTSMNIIELNGEMLYHKEEERG